MVLQPKMNRIAINRLIMFSLFECYPRDERTRRCGPGTADRHRLSTVPRRKGYLRKNL